MKLARTLLAALLLAATLLSFAACGEYTFDYEKEDMTKYVDFGGKDYLDMEIEVTDYTVTDEDVKKDFNAFFSSETQPYYLPKDPSIPIAQGDWLYFSYCGVKNTDLDKAIAEGKIADRNCTGLTFTQIVDLGIGFPGGTCSDICALKISAKNGFIPGFADALQGKVPAEHGDENPLAIPLTFPTDYDPTMAGAEVVFFCRLGYVGDKEAGYYTHETIDIDRLNAILGTSGERAYADLEACFADIRKYMEDAAQDAVREEKAAAIFAALTEKATFKIPQKLMEKNIDAWYRMAFDYVKQNSSEMYEYYFSENEDRAVLFNVLKEYFKITYTEESVNAEVEQSIQEEMVYRYIVQTEGYTVTDEVFAKWDAMFKEDFGSDYKEMYEDDVIRAAMLREEVVDILIAAVEERGGITYKPAE